VSPVPPVDDGEARALIRTGLGATQFVEAGAGTGKTTALVSRILELVCSGRTTLGHLAAITFTEAAAAELRDRIYEALELAVADEDDDAVADEDADAGVSVGPAPEREARRGRARAALDDIDGATISTLHGFAQRILAAHPFEAGLPPGFDVLDEGRSALAFDERWEGFVDRLLDDPSLQGPLCRLLACGGRIDHLRAVAEQCNRHWDLLLDVDPPPVEPVAVDASPVLGPLGEAIGLADHCTADDDLLLAHLRGLDGLRSALAASTDELETLQLLAATSKLSCTKGAKGSWGCPVDDVRGLLAAAESARVDLVTRAGSAALAALLPAIRTLTLEGAADRRREGRLEFHDLLVWSLELVRHHPAVRDALHRQYERLFVDEFQDTDPIQAELAARIAATGDCPPGVSWTDLPVEPGRLFFVGDPKQAIYRFRRADIGLFLSIRSRFEEERLALTDNFRSVPGVIDWVNEVFGSLLGAGEPGVQPAYEPLHPRRASHGEIDGTGAPAGGAPATDPPVVLLGGATDARSVETVREAEAADIAATVLRIRDEGWPVGEEGDPARLADITVLIPARTGLGILEEAFDDAGIPYRLGASSLVYDSAEVIELLAVLAAVDDPTDQVSLVAALRSAAFACGDDDLFGFHQAGGAWDYRAAPPEGLAPGNPVVDGMARLRGLHHERWWTDVSGLIDAVIERCHLMELALDERRHRDVWRRLRFVADQARQFADSFGGDLRRYLDWVELQRRDDVRAVEVVLPEPDDDAVQVMTVHGAKGLEFPVVVLAGLNRTSAGSRGVGVLWGAAGPEVRIRGDLRTPGFDDLAAREQRMERAQDLRLLYVAATRARDHLVVSLHHKAGSPCHAALLAPLCEGAPGLTRRLEGAGTPPVPVPPVTRDDDGADDDGDRQAWLVEHARLVGPGARPRTLAASTIASLGHPEDGHGPGGGGTVTGGERPSTGPAGSATGGPKGDLDLDTPPWKRGRGGTSVGRAVHAVLQAVDLATGEGVDALAAVQAVAEGVTGREHEIAAMVRGALGSELIRQAVAGGRFWRELYVGAPLTDRPDGPVLEGFVDLLVETPDGLVVVDYKTDSVAGDEDLDRAAERYRLQGATYALALERALGTTVARCVFLFLRTPSAEAREVDDLRAAMDEVAVLAAGG